VTREVERWVTRTLRGAGRKVGLAAVVSNAAWDEEHCLYLWEELAGAPDETTRAIRRGQLERKMERLAHERWNPRDG